MIATIIDFGLEVTYGDVFGPQIVVDEQFASILKIGDDAFYPSFAKRTPVLPGRWCRVEELQVVKRQVEHHWMLQ